MRIYIIRHADPDYPNNTITEQGHREAKALADRMETVGLDKIYTSPMGRARDTASYTAARLGLEPEVVPWTAELEWLMETPTLHGSRALWDYPSETFRAEAGHSAFDTWQTMPPLDKHALAEPFAKLGANSDAFLARHGFVKEGRRYRCVEPSSENIAVFCHGGFGLTWLSHLLEIPLSVMWAGFWLPPTSVSLILMERLTETAQWAVPRCIGLADTSHLYAAGLPIQPRGLYAVNWKRL